MKALLLTLAVFICFSATALAHPPSKVTLAYDAPTKKLNVTAVHKVKDVTTHFVITLEVSVNGKVVETKNYTVQTSKESLKTDLQLEGVAKGDKVEVKASCNKFGSKKGQLTI